MKQDVRHRRTLTVEEEASVSGLSLFLGYGAVAPMLLAALVVIARGGDAGGEAPAPLVSGITIRGLAIMWGGAILVFLAGVRRGLSFRTPGGARAAQIAMSAALFAAGFAAIFLSAFFPAQAPLGLVLLGVMFAGLAVLDPRAARRGETPLFFTRLRPPQMSLAALAYAAMLVVSLL